jgi:subtilase family serine protease
MGNSRPRRVFALACVLFALLALTAAWATPPGAQQLSGHLTEAVKRAPLVARLESSTQLSLAIGLPLRNQSQLNAALANLYNPRSAQYRHYLTVDQFAAAYGPTEQDYQSVIAFARAKGLTVGKTFNNRALVEVRGTADKIETAFHVTLNTYERLDGSLFHAPDREPSLDLGTPVLHIGGLENYVLPRKAMRTRPLDRSSTHPLAGSAPFGYLGGNDFRNAYAPGHTPNGAGQCVGLIEFDGFYSGDVSLYESQFQLPNVPIQKILLDGFDGTPGANNDEVVLDIDLSIAMAPGLSSIVVFEQPANTDSSYSLAEMASPTQGEPLCKQLSASWIFSTNANATQSIQEMAMQGQSFFAGAGDAGAYPSDPGDDRDQQYVTLVGGTNLSMNGDGASWQAEAVWPGSGGGILTSESLPSYQLGISMASNGGSTAHRNAPDVAAAGDYIYLYYNNGTLGAAGGTSAATPLWTAFMALVNQHAVSCGTATIGFANPALYVLANSSSYAKDFHDITSGNNNNGMGQAFNAVTGYDLASGWGSPNAGLIEGLSPQIASCPVPSAPSNLQVSAN